jgi:HEAT repeat protein
VKVKQHLRQLVEREDYGAIADVASRKRRVLGTLFSLTFDPDPLVAWRAVEALGAAADRIAEERPDYVLEYLRRLYWLLSEESGGIGWRAPEAMAEIVRRRPRDFSQYIPIVVSLIREMAPEDLEHFKAGILWAIGRLAPPDVAISDVTVSDTISDQVGSVLPHIVACLDDADPQVRGMAAWSLGQTGQTDRLAGRQDLLADDGPVDLYQAGRIRRVRVRDIAREALAAPPPA